MRKIIKSEFVKSATETKDFPGYNYPEFAFTGRSNVGKSSLINMLTGQRNLVKTGSRPGVTRMINFFLINGKISVADLPGFGYAEAPAEIKKKFAPMIKNYFSNRKNLRLVFVLIDSRRESFETEKDIISTLSELEIPTAIIMTKTDKLSKNELAKSVKKISSGLEIPEDSVFPTSTKNGTGKKELLRLLSDFAVTKELDS